MKNYEVILFDLDGTLTDPKVGITKAVQHALTYYDIHVRDLDDLEKFIGPPLADSFKEYYSFDCIAANKAVEYFREYFSTKGIYENQIYPNITKLLAELKKKGKVLALATSKPTVFAKKVLEHFAIDSYFTIIVGSNLDGTRVSKTEIIKHVFSELKIQETENVLMVGDRKYDVIGAKENNIDVVGVTYGYGSYEELKESESTYYVDTVNELFDLLIAG